MEFIKAVKVADAWVNTVACSDWKPVTPETCELSIC